MKLRDEQYNAYVRILKKELICAMGCTEPIAIAYAGAYATSLLDEQITSVDIYASGNIIKNVKSVVVPNTNGKKGIEAAAAIGIVSGNVEDKLEVIAHMNKHDAKRLDEFMNEVSIRVHHALSECVLEIMVTLHSANHQVSVKIKNEHTHVVYVKKDDKVLINEQDGTYKAEDSDYQLLSMKDIYDFAMIAELDDVKDILQRQIDLNSAIAQAGLEQAYGANIGNILLQSYGDSVQVRAKAMAAAGSDARMSGCELPVVINSGSGNQGMSASLPVVEYAKEYACSREQLYRALLISNLTTLYQKIHIGRLSAYCGAVSAGAGAGAGIAYLLGGDFDHVCHTIVNTLAITSGIFCDGAKASCAAKIASAVDAGILGCQMYRHGKQFYCGEGIVCHNIEETIANVGRLAKESMREIDEDIIAMMMKS